MNTNTAKMIEKRKKFDKLPSFLQAGLFLYDKYNNVRGQEFVPQILAFDLIKNSGNNHFFKHQFDEAVRKYEEVFVIYILGAFYI